MPIVSSVIVEDRVQRDLRRAIRERHIDHLGIIQDVLYLAEAGANVAAAMSSRVALLNATLAAQELSDNLAAIMAGNYTAVTTRHTTLIDVRAFLRALYKTGAGEVIGRVASYLLTLTDVQLRGVFGVSAGQTSALKSRLQAKVNALNAVLTMVGE